MSSAFFIARVRQMFNAAKKLNKKIGTVYFFYKTAPRKIKEQKN